MQDSNMGRPWEGSGNIVCKVGRASAKGRFTEQELNLRLVCSLQAEPQQAGTPPLADLDPL